MTNESGLNPVEYNVVVRLESVEKTTAGGIIIPDSKVDRDDLATDEGTLVAVSPHAFTYAEWQRGQVPPKVGDRILFAQYDGRIWEKDGVKYRIIKDKAVVAVIAQ